MNVLGITGFVSFFALLVIGMLMGAGIDAFVCVSVLILVVGGTCALGLMTYDFESITRVCPAMTEAIFRRKPTALTARDAVVLRGFITYVYAMAAISFFLSLTNLLWVLEDPADLLAGVALALLSFFYALILAEGLFRPCARRIEFLLNHCQPSEKEPIA